VNLVLFCAKVAMHQKEKGRFFVIEGNEKSRIFWTDVIQHLSSLSEIGYISLDQCSFEHLIQGKETFQRPTSFLTNIPTEVLRPLERRCQGLHTHLRVTEDSPGDQKRHAFGQVFPFALCKRLASCFKLLLRH